MSAKFFNYYGGKARMAPTIVGMLGQHDAYCEPFAGSAAVLFAKTPSRVEMVNDLDGDIVNLYRVVRDRPDELLAALEMTPYARDEVIACRDVGEHLNDIERARRYFTAVNGSYSGTMMGYAMSSAGSTSKAKTFRSRIAGMDAITTRLRDVDIENTDALDVIRRMDGPRTAHYIDPPYLGTTRDVTKGHGYRHDAPSEDFHRALLDAVVGLDGVVVLSGYANDLYDSALSRWHRFVVTVRSTARSGHHGGRDEVLWVNRIAPGAVLPEVAA